MPATILPFIRRHATGRLPQHEATADSEPPRPAVLHPPSEPTSRQIAHRWAMLSHLTRHYPRPRSDAPPT
jgi:hypothetical protein